MPSYSKWAQSNSMSQHLNVRHWNVLWKKHTNEANVYLCGVSMWSQTDLSFPTRCGKHNTKHVSVKRVFMCVCGVRVSEQRCKFAVAWRVCIRSTLRASYRKSSEVGNLEVSAHTTNGNWVLSVKKNSKGHLSTTAITVSLTLRCFNSANVPFHPPT